jgi:PRTRC genetic system protein E
MFMTHTETSEVGLFTQLEPLLLYRAVLITVSKLEGDRLQVNICPRQLKEGENPALTVPLCVTGSAAELDADLVPQLSRFVASHVGLNSNLAAIEKEIAEAEKAAREEAKKKHKAVNSGRKAAETTISEASPASSVTEVEPQSTPSLFDQQSKPVAENSIAEATVAAAQTE